MTEFSEGGRPGLPEQKAAVPYAKAEADLDNRLMGFTMDSMTLPDILIPNNSPDKTPLYPTTSKQLNAKLAFNSAVGMERSPSVEERGSEMFTFISSLGPSSEELTEARKDPTQLRELYTRPEVMHDIRLQDFLLDDDRANIVGLWAKMSDENFQKFYGLVKEDKLPKCLTSDEEMKRLQEDSKTVQQASSAERPGLSSARERLVDLALNPDYYVKDETGHAITPQLGGPKEYEFDPNIDIVAVMDQLRTEFQEEEK